MARTSGGSEGLRVELRGPTEVWRGELACGALRVVNTGDAPRTVSARLNLAEGDVRLRVTRPDGTTTRAWASRLVDSAARRVELQPGEAVESGIGLFHAHTGPIFAEAGVHRLVADYDAAPDETLSTPAIDVDVREPRTKEERALAEALGDRLVAQSLELGDPQSAAAQATLASIAQRFRDRREGRVAALILAAAEAAASEVEAAAGELVAAEGPIGAARTATALVSPAAPNASLVRDALQSRLRRTRAPEVATALAIVGTTPFVPRGD